MGMKLYVGNLSFSSSDEGIQKLLADAGEVESASVVEDRDTGRSRGFGFVEMSSKEEGEKAIAQFNGMEINSRPLTVNEAKPREKRGRVGRSFLGGDVIGLPGKLSVESREQRFHVKSGDQECVIEFAVDEEGKPTEGHAIIFTPAEEKQVAQYFEGITDSRKRASETLKEIEGIKKKTQAILDGLS